MTATEVILLLLGTLIALAVGSFTCVVIDRLPLELEQPNEYGDRYETRPWSEVLGGNSRCSSCGSPVRPGNNIPIVSWIVLRGRCRDCGERIPVYHPIVEILVPALFLVAVSALGWSWRIVPFLVLIPVGVAISVIDLQTLIVPTRLVWPTLGTVAFFSVLATIADGKWEWLVTALVGLVVLSGPLFALWFMLPAGMGFGDVRLAVLLGWTVGFYGGVEPAAGAILSIATLFLASLVGIVVGVTVLGARGRGAKVPFGPSLVAAAFAVILVSRQLLEPFGVWTLT